MLDKKKSKPFHLVCLPIPWKFGDLKEVHREYEVWFHFIITSVPKHFWLTELLSRDTLERRSETRVKVFLANAARSSFRGLFGALSELTVRSGDTWTGTSEEPLATQIFISVCNVYLWLRATDCQFRSWLSFRSFWYYMSFMESVK